MVYNYAPIIYPHCFVDGFAKASDLLIKGSKDRPQAKKHLWLITDAHEFTDDKEGRVKASREDLVRNTTQRETGVCMSETD